MTTNVTTGRRFASFYVPRVRLLVAIGHIFRAGQQRTGFRRMPGRDAVHYSFSVGEFGMHAVRFTWKSGS